MKVSHLFISGIFLIFLSCSNDDIAQETEEPESVDFSNEIFFSEYIEGSSFNKALEIVNLTGKNIDLEAENYSIKKQTNGSGDWMGEEKLLGELAYKQVIVITNESATITELIEKADQLKAGAPLDFNGNDPVGLFKDGKLIDIIGKFDNAEDFAKDIGLRRKKNQTEPASTYTPTHWEAFELDNFEGLGNY
ncbi:Lamin Tail Domain [Salegentibacter echinorum]|uniref:Lamin Tail Domain n=1 Tax=Salegentibacter echinorum TaxID=1073325 RepID=A0A1M5CGD2_SALEC|nr:hypothetical protein [Salegentibacter echinorum]SHF53824.1 Lamin Tail Domain [Salegentibacter echinorum]